MPFNSKNQPFGASINTMEIGAGGKTIKLGGENVMPFCSFDAAIENAPKVGIEVTDLMLEGAPAGMLEFYAGCSSVADMAKKAVSVKGADFLCVRFEGADPNGQNKSVEECVETAKSVAAAVDVPLCIMGCKNVEKDAALFEKVSEALQGKNVLILSAKEENYKGVGAAAGLAYGQKVGAESAVDINLAKQLNVLLTQLGVNNRSIAMNLGAAAAGYGFEYVVSTLDRVKLAALTQNDTMLQMPIIAPVAAESWSVKEALASEEDMPEWGNQEERGIQMEIVTASACLAAGANAVIVRHPRTVATISKLVSGLM